MSLQSLRADPEFQALSPERQRAVLEQYVLSEREENQPQSLVERTLKSTGRVLGRREGPSGPLGAAPDAIREPEHTDTVLRELDAPMRWAMGGKTFTERALPESFATRALSGGERALWLGLGALGTAGRGIGNVAEKGLEQAPRLVGQPAASTPVSRAAGDVPGLILQALMPGAKGASPRVARSVEAAQLRADAEALGIDLSGPEATMSPALRRIEGVVERLPFGASRILNRREAQRAQTQAAVDRTGPLIGTEEATKTAAGAPARTLAEAKVLAAQEQENARLATKAAQAGTVAQGEVSDFVTSLGPGQESAAFLRGTQKSLRDAKRLARSQGNALYREAENIGGDRPVIVTRNLADTASALHAQEAELAKLAKPAVLGAAETLKNMALVFSEKYGLNELQTIPYKRARILDSRLGARIRVAQRAGDSDAARMLGDMQKALRADIDEVAVNDRGDLGVAMRRANEHWRTRYIEPFGPKTTIRKLLESKEARDFDSVLYDPQGAESIAAIKTELMRTDPGAWKAIEKRFGERLLRESFDPTTGNFDASRFTGQLHKYSQESLSAILGDKAQAVNALRTKFQAAARAPEAVDNPIQAAKIFQTFAQAAPEVIVEGLAKQPMSRLVQIRTAMNPQDWSVLARTWWEEVVLPQTLSQAGVFSRSRFLSQLKKVDDEKLAVLLGDEAGEHVATLRRMMSAQERLHPLGDNTSGTTQVALATGQMIQVGTLIGAIASGNVTAITATGLSILAPSALARLLTSPGGSRLAVEAARAVPGTAAAQQVAKRIAIFLANEDRREERAK